MYPIKRPVSKICKELLRFNSKKANNSIKMWAKAKKISYLTNDINIGLKRLSKPQIEKEIQKPTLTYIMNKFMKTNENLKKKILKADK